VTLKITSFFLLLLLLLLLENENENEEKPKAVVVNGQVVGMFKFNFTIFIIDVYPLEILKMSSILCKKKKVGKGNDFFFESISQQSNTFIY
jgi:hypothetical protein